MVWACADDCGCDWTKDVEDGAARQEEKRNSTEGICGCGRTCRGWCDTGGRTEEEREADDPL